MRRGEIRRPGDRPTRQLHAKDALAGLSRSLGENAEPLVSEHALHDELALLELTSFDEIARRTFLGSPDDRHGLKILCADRAEELLDRGTRRGSAGEWPGRVGAAARGEDQDERDDRTLHRVSPAYL